MTDIFEKIAEIAAREAGIPAVTAPAAASGEKIIWRVRLSSYDGEWETFDMTMRFVSRTVKDAYARAEAVSRYLCAPGDARSAAGLSGGANISIKRIASESSGYISRTGHFYVIAKFRVKRRLGATLREGIGTIY